MDPIDVILIAHGSERHRQRALYAVLSFIQRHSGPAEWAELHIFTDVPGHFESLKNHVHLHHLATDEVERWTAEADGYRNIIKLQLLRRRERTFLFLDSDVLVTKRLDKLAERLSPDISIMQEREFQLGRRDELKELVSRGAEFGVTAQTWMYNSGLLGVHTTNLPLLADALDLALRFRRENLVRTADQLADGICLARSSRILVAPDSIVHYWQDKERFDALLDARFNRFGAERAVDACVSGLGASLFQLGLRSRPASYRLLMRFKEGCEKLGAT